MPATNPRRHLFGGALRSAGVVMVAMATTPANASVEPAEPIGVIGQIGNKLRIVGVGMNETNVNYEAAFNDPLAASAPAIALTAYANAFAMGGALTVTEPDVLDGYTESFGIQWFTVTSATQILIEWNLADVDGGVALSAYLDGGLIIGDQSGSVGAESAILTPGTLYYFAFQMSVSDSIDNTVESFVRMTIVPAPGVICLLTGAMLSTRQRRRGDSM